MEQQQKTAVSQARTCVSLSSKYSILNKQHICLAIASTENLLAHAKADLFLPGQLFLGAPEPVSLPLSVCAFNQWHRQRLAMSRESRQASLPLPRIVLSRACPRRAELDRRTSTCGLAPMQPWTFVDLRILGVSNSSKVVKGS